MLNIDTDTPSKRFESGICPAFVPILPVGGVEDKGQRGNQELVGFHETAGHCQEEFCKA